MRRRWWLSVVIVVVAVVVVAGVWLSRRSPGQSEMWYWALNDDKGQLLAYTLDGQAKTLVESGFSPEGAAIWRMNAESALAVLNINGTAGLYHLTPDAIRPIALPSKSPPISALKTLVIRHDPYAVLTLEKGSSAADTAVVVDLTTDSAALLTGKMVTDGANTRMAFSQDGQALRYASLDDETGKTNTIWERTLQGGTERAIYRIKGLAMLTTDRYGENWIYSDGRQTTFIEASGQFKTQDESVKIIRSLYGDHVVSYKATCKADCPITWQPEAGGDALTFTLPNEPDFSILAKVDATHLLTLLNGKNYLLLVANGSAVPLGRYAPKEISTPLDETVSPDGRWVLALTGVEGTDVTQYGVWDNFTHAIVMQNDPARAVKFLNIYYGAGGFVVGEDAKHFRLYRASDGKVVELPDIDGAVYYDVLADGTVLCALSQASDVGGKGIYRYDPAANTFSLLVADAIPLVVQ